MYRAIAVVLVAAPLAATAAHETPRAVAALDFVPPKAGSYLLPPIQAAPAGRVLDVRGRARPLGRFVTGKVTLLSLFYTQCADPEGCPLAISTMIDLRDRLRADPAMSRRIRLVSLSLDPAHDTPARLAAFSHHLADRGLTWEFLTTVSMRSAAPLLDGFGQDLAVEQDGARGGPRVISHMLKLFLIDRMGMVREIYSTAFLQPEVVYNDVVTLLLDDAAPIR